MTHFNIFTVRGSPKAAKLLGVLKTPAPGVIGLILPIIFTKKLKVFQI